MRQYIVRRLKGIKFKVLSVMDRRMLLLPKPRIVPRPNNRVMIYVLFM